ncbi:hypothetical protein PCASD_10704 [Puccinia coronata f. sp. avenae]|uniref:Uncharacterized protein n=1 Tax=Puccinia coronata f. sp. avenae TaxID=200324 RepID=A0A2N5UPX4_9BASI|nr:hypothetical protein PCASD_10704 [Puccinia coronata f. sp. avenae]
MNTSSDFSALFQSLTRITLVPFLRLRFASLRIVVCSLAYEYLYHVGEAKDWLELVLEMNQDDGLIPAASPCLPHPAGSPMESLSGGLPDLSASADPTTTTTHQLHNLSVTEFPQTLRDGAIPARLVRRFRGREHVPRIFIHPKLQYRHSNNINYFFQFLRFVRHLLAKRGLAERIGNLVGKLQFSNDQL